MYGIMSQDGARVMCYFWGPSKFPVLLQWDNAQNIIIKESAIEIDQLLQVLTTANNNYSLVVFKLSDEFAEKLLMEKLKGH